MSGSESENESDLDFSASEDEYLPSEVDGESDESASDEPKEAEEPINTVPK